VAAGPAFAQKAHCAFTGERNPADACHESRFGLERPALLPLLIGTTALVTGITLDVMQARMRCRDNATVAALARTFWKSMPVSEWGDDPLVRLAGWRRGMSNRSKDLRSLVSDHCLRGGL